MLVSVGPAIATGGVASGVAINGGYAYVAAGQAGVVVVDVRNPTGARVVATNLDVHALSITVSGELVLATTVEKTLEILGIYRPGLTLAVLHPPVNGVLELQIEGLPGQSVRVERSETLFQWETIQTVILEAAPVVIADPQIGPSPLRYYRAVWP